VKYCCWLWAHWWTDCCVSSVEGIWTAACVESYHQ